MLSFLRLSDITDSMTLGFITDAIVLAIARLQRFERIEDSDKKAFIMVEKFLSGVVEVRGDFYTAAAKRAKQALSPKETFVDYIQGLLKTTRKIVNQESVRKEEVEKLRKFFSTLGGIELGRTDCLFEGDNPVDLDSFSLVRAYR